MRAALAAALAERATIVFAQDLDSPMDTVAAVRQADRESARESGFVLLVLGPTVSNLDRAMLLAAVGPLAEELAPYRQIGALDLSDDAAIDDIISAATFLVGATSTTGQVLRVTA